MAGPLIAPTAGWRPWRPTAPTRKNAFGAGTGRVQAGLQRRADRGLGWSGSAATSPASPCPAASSCWPSLVGVPALLLGRLRCAGPCSARAAGAALPEGADRRLAAPHRRDRQRAAPRAVAGLRGARRADTSLRRGRGDRHRHPGAGQRGRRHVGGPARRRRRDLFRGRWPELRRTDAASRLGPRAAQDPRRGGPQRHRHLQRPGAGPAGRRPAAHAHRSAHGHRGLPLGQAPLRPRRVRLAARRVLSALRPARSSRSSASTAALSSSSRPGSAARAQSSAA